MDDIARSEHLLNVYASRHAKFSCGDFGGYLELASDAPSISKHLTAGLWLVRTLSAVPAVIRPGAACSRLHTSGAQGLL